MSTISIPFHLFLDPSGSQAPVSLDLWRHFFGACSSASEDLPIKFFRMALPRNVILFFTLVVFVVKADQREDLRLKYSQDLLASEDDNYDDYDDNDDGGGGRSFFEATADRILGVNQSTPAISCVSCESPDCSNETVCFTSFKCYSSIVRDTDGLERKSKGSFLSSELGKFYLDSQSGISEAFVICPASISSSS